MPAHSKIYNEELFYPDKKMTENEKRIYNFLDRTLVGQTGPKKALASKLSHFGRNLLEPNLPAMNILLVGPSGCGKNKTAKAISFLIYGREDAVTIIDCEDPNPLLLSENYYTRFSREIEILIKTQGHVWKCLNDKLELAKKQKDVGDKDAPVMIKVLRDKILEAREKLQFFMSKTLNGITVPIILFENVDKAGPGMFNTLIDILKRSKTTGMIPYMSSVRLTENDFSNALIIMTMSSNPIQIVDYFKKNGVLNKNHPTSGFSGHPIDKELNLIRLTEMIGKDNIIIYRNLKEKEIMKIIDKELSIISSAISIRIDFTDAFREFLFKETTSGLGKDRGAHYVNAVIKENVQDEIEKLILSTIENDPSGSNYPLKGKSLIFDRIITGKNRKKEETVIKILSLSPDRSVPTPIPMTPIHDKNDGPRFC